MFFNSISRARCSIPGVQDSRLIVQVSLVVEKYKKREENPKTKIRGVVNPLYIHSFLWTVMVVVVVVVVVGIMAFSISQILPIPVFACHCPRAYLCLFSGYYSWLLLLLFRLPWPLLLLLLLTSDARRWHWRWRWRCRCWCQCRPCCRCQCWCFPVASHPGSRWLETSSVRFRFHCVSLDMSIGTVATVLLRVMGTGTGFGRRWSFRVACLCLCLATTVSAVQCCVD